MRKTALLLLALGLVAATTVHAANPVRISQVYGGGGSTYKADYVELFNNSSAPVNIGGWSVQYASSTGTAFGSATYARALIPSGATIPACGYYLVTGYVSTAGANLPVTADLAQGSMNLNSAAAKVALFSDQVFNRTCATAQSSGMLVDLIGWGGSNCSETSTAAASDNTSVLVRGLGGATDTDNNSADFSKLAATGVTIHNSSSAANPQCAPVSALRLEQNFDFTGNLTANGWTQSGTTGTPTIASSSPGLTYSGYAGSGIGNSAAFAAVVGQRVSKSFTSVNSGSVYLAFLLNGTSAATTGDTFVQLGQALGGTQCNFFAKSATGGFNMGIGKAFTATYATPVYSLNTTYLVVVKYTFVSGSSNDEMRLFVNPAIGGAEPAANATTISGTDAATSLGHLQIEQYSANQLAGRIDGIRIATTWADAVASGVPTTPAAPVATAGTSVTTTDFQANWNASTGATSYRLDVSTDSGFGSYVTGYQDLTVSGLSQAVSGLSASTTYYYRARAVNVAGASGNSNTITVTTSAPPTPPAAPVATAGTSVTDVGFTANWGASSGATSYQLDVATDNGFTSYVTGYQNLTVSGLSQAVSGLTASTTYYYRARAVNAAGASGNSNTITVTTSTPPAGTRYVDAVGGNDALDGLSEATAWKTLEKVNARTYQPGDRILLKRGSVWNGSRLAPPGSGALGAPIVVSAYGSGALPVINGTGTNASTIYLQNQQYWEVENLEVTNLHPTNSRAVRYGIHVLTSDFGAVKHLVFRNLVVHDVNGNLAERFCGGMFFEVTGTATPTWFDSLIVEGCDVSEVSPVGIQNVSTWDTRTLTTNTNWTPSLNVILRNNTIHRTGRNGMIVRVARRPFIEWNVFEECAKDSTGNAIYPFNCDSALIQYNEASLTRYNAGDDDGAGIDADYRCKSTIIQYNYVHDNEYGGIVIVSDGGGATTFLDGTVVRYNVLKNNKNHAIRTSGNVTNTKIYNNTIYTGSSSGPVILVWHKDWGGYSSNTSYYDNIFETQASGCSYSLGSSTGNLFDYNLFHGVATTEEPADAHKLTGDPQFADVGSTGAGWSTAAGFALLATSPAVNSGVAVSGHPALDYLGNLVPFGGQIDQGAFEYQGLPPTVPAAPVATAGTSVTTTGFQANWNASSGATSYRLDVSTSSGFATYVTGYQDLTVAGLSQAVSGLTASTTYYYRVRAVNAAGTSGNSNTITAATSAPPVSQAFTLVLIPDTQTYTAEISGGTMAMYTAQTQWIVNNRVSRNIAAVGHLGDITEDDTAVQWQRADGAHDLLENPVTTGLTDGIPYAMSFGNHDDNGGGTLFDQYFGISRFSGRSYYGGHFSTTNKNSYTLFSAGGLDWVMVSLQYQPGDYSGLLDWADGIFSSYPTRKGILITHSMLYPGLDWSPGGQAIYDALKDRPNLVLAACGHMNGSNYRTDVYGSNKLTTMVSDYQGDANGGNGYLKYLEIDPPLNQVRAFTYSPYAGTSLTDAFNQFVLNDVPLGGGAPTVPAAPVATAGTGASQSGFQANWNASSGASSYRLDVSTSSSFTSYVTGYQDLTVTGTSWAVSGLSASTAYYYRARAVNAAGTSGNSNTITVTTSAPSTPPAAPVATAATNILGTSCQANWNASTGATSYRLDVSADESFATFVTGYQDLTVSGASQAVSGLSATTSYYYRVRAVNAYGTSGSSNVITLDTGVLTPPAAPVATAGTSVTTTSFQANWNASSGATSYRLDVSTSSGFATYVAGYQDLTVSGLSQAVSGLSATTTYYYRIRAVNADGTSGNSNTITVTTSAPVTTRLEENFSFTGNLTANGWTQSGTGTPTIAASSPGLVYSGYAGSDIGNSAAFAAAAGEDVSKSFTSVSSGSVYTAFLLNLTAAGSTTGAYFVELGQAQAAMNCNLHARSATGGFNLGISKAGTATWGSAVYSLNTTYLVTVKYTVITGTGNDEVKLFVNPVIGAAEPTATATSTAGTDATGLGYLQIQQYSTSQAAGRIDGIRIATTWADAVASGAPPTPPAAPVATAGTSVTDVGFTANWGASSGATSYQLDVATDNGFTSYVTGYQNLTVSGLSQAVSGLTASTAYYYRARAVNAAGASGNSNTITVTTTAPPPPPAAPVATAGTSVTTTGFTANWNASSGATSYRLDVSTSSGFVTYVTGYQDKTVSGISQAVSGLTASTVYYYRVRAVNSAGTSGNSNTITVTTSTPPPPSAQFVVVHIGDTQEYYGGSSSASIGNGEMAWVANNRAAHNIVALTTVGDITETGASSEYTQASTAYAQVENPTTTGLTYGIPWVPLMGNHDASSGFNTAFPVSRFSGRSYYGGHYGSDMTNNYILFSGGGLDFVLVGLSIDPSSAVLTWAHGVIASYPTRLAIVSTHNLLNDGGTQGSATWSNTSIYPALRDLPNLRMMLCGHMHGGSGTADGEQRRSDTYLSNTIHSIIADYQDRTAPGNVRLWYFEPANNRVRARTYSTVNGTFETDADSSSQFTLTVNLAPPGGAMMSPAPVETDEPAPVIRSLALAPPAPNPARGALQLSFDLPRAMHVSLEILDVQGRLVAQLAEGEFGPGRHPLVWNSSTARGRAVGLYFVRLQTPEGRLMRRVVVLD